MRRFTEMIDHSSPSFSTKSVARVKKISAHHTSRVPRKALTLKIFSLFGYLSFRGLMRDLLGGLTCPRLISFGKVSLRLLGRALLAIWTLAGNVTCTFKGLQNPASMHLLRNRCHSSIALELWILKVRIMSRFPLFYISEAMKSLTDNKSLHPCGWTEELIMPPV